MRLLNSPTLFSVKKLIGIVSNLLNIFAYQLNFPHRMLLANTPHE
jgi:hypothetical protein